uniref:Putative pogo family transposase n=1 Tax=Ixodes ricinus TaxID=34613 RepID=A0A0K8RF00_IXORI
MLARRFTLVLEAFWGHNTKEVKTRLADGTTNLIMIPRGMTPVLQPMDVCLNKPFKAHVKRMYTEWIAEEEYDITPTGRIRKADMQ